MPFLTKKSAPSTKRKNAEKLSFETVEKTNNKENEIDKTVNKKEEVKSGSKDSVISNPSLMDITKKRFRSSNKNEQNKYDLCVKDTDVLLVCSENGSKTIMQIKTVVDRLHDAEAKITELENELEDANKQMKTKKRKIPAKNVDVADGFTKDSKIHLPVNKLLHDCINSDKCKTQHGTGIPWSCGICGFQGTNVKSVILHEIKKHAVFWEQQDLKMMHIVLRKCPDCTYVTESDSTMKRHRRTHLERERTYKCDQCSLSFYDEKTRHQHVLNVHNRTFAESNCEQCGYVFRSAVQFTVHILQGHPPINNKKVYAMDENKNAVFRDEKPGDRLVSNDGGLQALFAFPIIHPVTRDVKTGIGKGRAWDVARIAERNVRQCIMAIQNPNKSNLDQIALGCGLRKYIDDEGYVAHPDLTFRLCSPIQGNLTACKFKWFARVAEGDCYVLNPSECNGNILENCGAELEKEFLEREDLFIPSQTDLSLSRPFDKSSDLSCMGNRLIKYGLHQGPYYNPDTIMTRDQISISH